MDKMIDDALAIAVQYGQIDGDHHKAWAIDQMVRVLTKCPMVMTKAVDCNGRPYEYPALGESAEYLEFVRCSKDGDDGPDTYTWDIGVAP